LVVIRKNFEGGENKKGPSRDWTSPEVLDWLVSLSHATTSPARQDMEMMLRVVGSDADHPDNLTESRTCVNIECGANCE